MKKEINLVSHEQYLLLSRRKFIKQSVGIVLATSIPIQLTISKNANASIFTILFTITTSVVAGVLVYYITTFDEGEQTIDKDGRRVRVYINQNYCIQCGVCEEVIGTGARLEEIQRLCPVDAIEWKYE